MYRGTTPTLYFKINNIEDFSSIEDIWVTIRNKDKILINRTYKDDEVRVDEDEQLISIELSEKETLSFRPSVVKTQIKVLFTDGKICVSPIFSIEIEDILNPKEITPEEDDETEEDDDTSNETEEDDTTEEGGE